MNIETGDEVYDIYIKKLNHETVATIKSNEGETRAIEVVKENIEEFTKKTINLIKDSEGRIFVESVKWDIGDSPNMSHLFVEKCKNKQERI